MKNRLIIVTISSALLIMGCAQKEVSSIGVDNKGTENSALNGNTNGNEYENVDLYNRGDGSYTYNSTYGDTDGAGLKNIYFDTDRYTITADKLHTVRNNSKILSSAVRSGSRVKIEGHCDATGTDEYNYALGLRRAKSAKDAISSSGIQASSITVVSMGESSPECSTGYSSACYAKNRRVEFRVIR